MQRIDGPGGAAGRMARALLVLLAALLGVIGARSVLAGSTARDFWARNDPTSAIVVDHSAWTAFLARYVSAGNDGINRVDYGGVSPDDRAALARYIASLEGVPVTRLTRAEQLAYWVNLYNAATVRLILEHYPVASIRDISTGFFSIGPWSGTFLTIEGRQVSLGDIENGILRPIWHDPRVHYALNCAALGCPNLQPVAFSAASTDELLERGAKAFVNHPRGVMISYDRLIVSSIYRWYKDDFGGTDATVIAHLKHYAQPQLAAELDRIRAIYDNHYDWRLNDARK